MSPVISVACSGRGDLNIMNPVATSSALLAQARKDIVKKRPVKHIYYIVSYRV